MRKLKNGLIAALILAGILAFINPDILKDMGLTRDDANRVARAYDRQQSNLVVEVEGRVTALLANLSDDANYQRFLLELPNRHVVTIWHNTDIARPVNVSPGSRVRLRGEYDWTPDGGKIHWTHRDPAGKREGGWLKVL